MGSESTLRGLTLRKLCQATPARRPQVNKALIELTRGINAAMLRQQSELDAIRRLYDLSTRSLSPDTFDSLLDEILGTALILSQADMGSLQLYDDQAGELEIRAHSGFARPLLDFFARVRPHPGMCGSSSGAACARRQRVIVEDVRTSRLFAGTTALDVLLAAGVLAQQSTPLISRDGRLVGMLSTHYRQPIQAGQLDLRFIDLLCGQAADIIVQFQSQQDLRRKETALRRHRDHLAELFRQQTRQLQRSERLYRSLVDNAPIIIARFDREFRYLYRSPYAVDEYFKHNPDAFVGKTWAELGIPENVYRPWREKLVEARDTARPVQYETSYPDKNGELRDYLAWVVPELDETGQTESLLAFFLDITERKKLEAELLRLDRLNTVGEMAAAIGHEVRNPLTTVRGYLQLFLRKAESDKYREQFITMIDELDRANVIISDFLSLARNRAVDFKNHNLNDVISTLLPLLQAEALRTGHELAIDMGDVPDFPMDEKEIRQLILNLARNAFEAMEPGGKLTIATTPGVGRVVLSVRDTGPGMPQKVLDKLGTPFVTTKDHGTGLGLPICYRIAERHGAEIAVKTSPQGTTFFVNFKL